MTPRKLFPSFRFGIRALFAIIALSSVCFYFYLQYASRREAIDVLEYHGFNIKHVEAQGVPFYLRLAASVFGERSVFPVQEIGNFAELHHPGVLDAVAQLTELKHLKLEYQEQGLALDKLRALVHVEKVTAIKGFVLDDSFLSSFTQLEVFSWDEGEFQSDLSVFGQHERLREISIASVAVKLNDDSFAQLCKCSQLEKLELYVNAIELSELSPILNLTNLKEVRGLLDPKNPKHVDIIERLPIGCVVE